jgi:hypothetical protein
LLQPISRLALLDISFESDLPVVLSLSVDHLVSEIFSFRSMVRVIPGAGLDISDAFYRETKIMMMKRLTEQ